MILISKTDSERVIGRKDAYNRACAIADRGTDAGMDEHAIIDAILTGLADLIAEPIQAAPSPPEGQPERRPVEYVVLCEGCPPVGYPTNKTRCTECPRSMPQA